MNEHFVDVDKISRNKLVTRGISIGYKMTRTREYSEPFSGVDKIINGTPNSRRDMSGLRSEHQ